MNKNLLLALLVISSFLFYNCEDDDSKCPKGEIEQTLPDGSTFCIPDIQVPVNPNFPGSF